MDNIKRLEDNRNIETNSQSDEYLKWFESKVKQEQKTILYLAYLTTLARLSDNRDLDELFDWDIKLWEEEMFSIYSLTEIINWSNSIDNLKPPHEMNLDWNWAQDYSYKIDYEEYYLVDWKYYKEDEIPSTIKDKDELEKKRVIKTLTWDWSLPFNETDLVFNYDEQLNISNIEFKRPANNKWVWLNQEIEFSRNNKWLVDNMTILRWPNINNELSITYNSIWKPEVIEQTKLWLISDKIVYEYDDNWNLKTIIYIPTLSLKHITWLARSYKSWKNAKGIAKWLQLAWEYITFEVLKKIKWNDVIEISNNDGLPMSTKSDLKSSNWYYTKWFSEMKYSENKELQELYLEMEDIWPDDKKSIKLKY